MDRALQVASNFIPQLYWKLFLWLQDEEQRCHTWAGQALRRAHFYITVGRNRRYWLRG